LFQLQGMRPVYQQGSPSALDAFYGSDKADSARYHHPGLEWVGTKLSYCNGKIQAGSSNITLYMVWAYEIAPCIAQTLHLMRSFRLE